MLRITVLFLHVFIFSMVGFRKYGIECICIWIRKDKDICKTNLWSCKDGKTMMKRSYVAVVIQQLHKSLRHGLVMKRFSWLSLHSTPYGEKRRQKRNSSYHITLHFVSFYKSQKLTTFGVFWLIGDVQFYVDNVSLWTILLDTQLKYELHAVPAVVFSSKQFRMACHWQTAAIPVA